jgi:hypothetical protein
MFRLLLGVTPFALKLPWIIPVLVFFGWLALGLLLAVAGLARGGLAGRVCSALALGLWMFVAWLVLLKPIIIRPHSRASAQPNPAASVDALITPVFHVAHFQRRATEQQRYAAV